MKEEEVEIEVRVQLCETQDSSTVCNNFLRAKVDTLEQAVIVEKALKEFFSKIDLKLFKSDDTTVIPFDVEIETLCRNFWS